MIAFTVNAKPVSTNASYRRGRGRRLYKTPEAEAFWGHLQAAARRAMRGARPMEGHLSARVQFTFDSERPDLDGPIKPTLDALQGIVYGNDRQIRTLLVERSLDRERPRVEVSVWEVTP